MSGAISRQHTHVPEVNWKISGTSSHERQLLWESFIHVSFGDARARETIERVSADREELWLLTQADRSTMRYAAARVRVSARTPYNER